MYPLPDQALRLRTGHYAFVPYAGRRLSNVDIGAAFSLSPFHDAAVTIIDGAGTMSDSEWKQFPKAKAVTHRFLNTHDHHGMGLDQPGFADDMKLIMKAIPEMVDDEGNHSILIHCYAGISRSAALTLWTMYLLDVKQYGPMTGFRAEGLVKAFHETVNPLATPNRSIMRYIVNEDPAFQLVMKRTMELVPRLEERPNHPW